MSGVLSPAQFNDAVRWGTMRKVCLLLPQVLVSLPRGPQKSLLTSQSNLLHHLHRRLLLQFKEEAAPDQCQVLV
jgi:hypothetical protein